MATDNYSAFTIEVGRPTTIIGIRFQENAKLAYDYFLNVIRHEVRLGPNDPVVLSMYGGLDPNDILLKWWAVLPGPVKYSAVSVIHYLAPLENTPRLQVTHAGDEIAKGGFNSLLRIWYYD